MTPHGFSLSLIGYTFSVRGFRYIIRNYCLTLIYLAYVNNYVLISSKTLLPVCILSSSSERTHSFYWWLHVFPIREYEGCFFPTSDRASKEVRNKWEQDLRVACLRSSPTTTSAVVGSNASVVADVRAREYGRYDRYSRQM